MYEGIGVIKAVLDQNIEADYQKPGISSPSIKDTIRKDTEPLVKRFAVIIQRIKDHLVRNEVWINNSFDFNIHIADLIEIKDDRAFIGPSGMNTIKEHFTAAIETENQQKAYQYFI